MKKLFFILTILTFGLFIKTALAFDCQKLKKTPKIEFLTSYGKLTYDSSKTQKEITSIAQKNKILEKGLFAAGLSTIQVSWEINVNTIAEVINENEICVIPEAIEIFIGYQDPKIYLANNLTPNTCHYNIVLRHEQTHQQINKSTLEHFLPYFHKAANKIASELSIEKVSNVSQISKATQKISYQYSREMSPLIKFFKKQLLTEQYKLDNEENYNYEADLCSN